MNVLNCNLEPIETSGFGRCYFCGKVAAEIFVDNTIQDCKEGQDVGDEVLHCG